MTSDAQGSNTFGVLLQRLRLEAGFSQEELAERAGLSRRGIADLERGARRSPRPSTVRRLSLGLGLDEGGRATLLAGARPNVHSGVTDTAGPPSLPVSSGPLVGRERELAEVRRLLGSTRLLTLTGAGGSGKTRLALEAARASADAYPDGTVLVLLASLTDAHMVAPAIANALGVRERAGVSVREVLAAYLRPRRMLLLLDNFEHLLDASQLVADLLATCPHLAVLATSREALRVHEEQEFPVLPLALPAEGDVSIPALRRCGSVQLFARRAAQACAAFAVTPDNARAVAAICARLDGLPLALELAAAWLKVLTPELLLWRLDRRLPLLAGGARDLPERQRTLRATIAWSDDLLDASDRCLFQRLAVGSGGCTLEAAETLGASVASPDRPVLKALAALVDKNLLQRQGDAGAEPRFTMLETIREYALEQLRASGELDQARQMHAAYYLTWLATADPRRSPTPTGGWVRRLDLEYDNLREAVRWCLDHRAISLVADAGTALTRYGIFRGHLREMRQWWEHALEQSVGAQPAVWPTVGFLLAMVLFLQGEPARVRPLLTESLARFRRQGDRRGTAHALLQLAYAELVDGNMTHEAVVPLLREAEGLFRELGQHEDVAWTLLGLGNAAQLQGDPAKAESLYLQAFAVVHGVRQPATIAQALAIEGVLGLVLASLGAAALERGDLDLADARLREGALQSARLSDLTSLGTCAVVLAGVALGRTRWARAARLLGAAEGLCTGVDSDLLPPYRTVYERVCTELERHLDEQAFASMRARASRLRPAAVVAYALGADDALQVEDPLEGLTPREREVARLAASGLRNREIARTLVITEGTARVHVEHVLAKLDLGSRAQLAAWAVEHGLLRNMSDGTTNGIW